MSEKKSHLQLGMIVRVPFDLDDPDSITAGSREFRTGKIAHIQDTQLAVEFLHTDMGRSFSEKREYDIANVERCLLPRNVSVKLISDISKKCSLLSTTESSSLSECDLVEYYVQTGEEIETVKESDLIFNSHYQWPDPIEQMKNFELHNPIWLMKRNEMIESYRELQNTTFGIEALVGTRVELLAHQAEVIAEVLSNTICRYVLADEVGLGKTIEACVILKSLKQREQVNTLIVVPRSLIQQWHNELDNKFWLDFHVIDTADAQLESQDIIISSEALQTSPKLALWVKMQTWDLVILDEAHRASQNPELFDTLLTLSELSRHVLLLSATPIQREAKEYIALLKLVDPDQYDKLDDTVFEDMLNSQQAIREVISYLARDLTPEYFNAEIFHEEMNIIVSELEHDTELKKLISEVNSDNDLDKAKNVIAYVSTNYRIESQIIRNRRKTLREYGLLTLPDRKFEMQYSYLPVKAEQRVLQALHGYADLFRSDHSSAKLLRAFFISAFSSPFALKDILSLRLNKTTDRIYPKNIRDVFSQPLKDEETQFLDELRWLTEKWEDEFLDTIDNLPRTIPRDCNNRFAKVISYLDIKFTNKQKVVIFSRWHPTLINLEKVLRLRYGASRIVKFMSGMDSIALQEQVDKFQSDDECLFILTDETGGEGRNFQIAQGIVHVDLPWIPTLIEQRTGRVDRLGREGNVESVVPFAISSLESDLVTIWQDCFNLFSESMSGLEIVLESVQNDILNAFINDSRDGIANLYDDMNEKAQELRKAVEEERYYEESTGNQQRSRELRSFLERYDNGDELSEPILEWSSLAGLRHHYNPQTRIASIGERDFNLKSIQNANFINPPNMQDALIRSKRPNNRVLSGTFDRKIAVKREDLIFFAPGEPWVDTIVQNALLSDRGRCCAVRREDSSMDEPWYGFEYTFTSTVNPRPLFEARLLPVHLFKSGEFFTLPATHKVLVSLDDEIMSYSSLPAQIVRKPYSKSLGDMHMGKRGGINPPILELKNFFTKDDWENAVTKTYSNAFNHIQESYTQLIVEDADAARNELSQRIRGQRATIPWLPEERKESRRKKIDFDEKVNEAIVEGIMNPDWILESVCFWVLMPK